MRFQRFLTTIEILQARVTLECKIVSSGGYNTMTTTLKTENVFFAEIGTFEVLNFSHLILQPDGN